MEQKRVATIMNLQTQLSQIAPELGITPKKKDTHEEETDRETQLLTQDYSAAFTTVNAQTTPQKIKANSPYDIISNQN